MRGPLVYCAESVDNDFSLADTVIDLSSATTEEEKERIQILGMPDVPVLGVGAAVRAFDDEGDKAPLYAEKDPEEGRGRRQVRLRLVPYFARENRGGKGEMRVWFAKRD